MHCVTSHVIILLECARRRFDAQACLCMYLYMHSPFTHASKHVHTQVCTHTHGVHACSAVMLLCHLCCPGFSDNKSCHLCKSYHCHI